MSRTSHGVSTSGRLRSTARTTVSASPSGVSQRVSRGTDEPSKRPLLTRLGHTVVTCTFRVPLLGELEAQRLAEPERGPLAARVRRPERDAEEGGGTRDDHDVRVRALQQVGQEGVRDADDAEGVHPVGQVVLLEGDVEEGPANTVPALLTSTSSGPCSAWTVSRSDSTAPRSVTSSG